MKVKELESMVNVAWSPQNHYPVMLATGSAAQQVDQSFSSTSSIDIYGLNLADPGYDLEQLVSIPTEHKFLKLVWASSGVLVGGSEGGLIQFFKVEDLLKGKHSVIASNNKHSGDVLALDLNPFQKNLLCSGAAESEIFIWDLNNSSTPMAPGNKVQPLELVQGLSWNRQVQHILASTFTSRCVVWDLRKNEPIIKLSDGSARTRWKSAVWHPSVATQLCIASADEQNPVIQLWDLRLATSPMLTMEGHQKGVLALSWCQQDSDLLLSAGKDGRVLCWNPNNSNTGGELLLEVCNTRQWIYDVSWCPKNPNLFYSCSNDSHVGIYSINGGTKLQQVPTTNKIIDSFPGMESLHQAPVAVHPETEPVIQMLPRPPQWTRRPIRASFGFGGKLVTFENTTNASTGQNGVASNKQVFISQITTEPELVERARILQNVIGAAGSDGAAQLLAEHCLLRGDEAVDQHEKYIWHFLKANFSHDPRYDMLNLLGFRHDDLSSKLNEIMGKLTAKKQQNDISNNVDQITDRMAGLSRSESSETEPEPSTDTSTDVSALDGATAFDNIAQGNKISQETKPPAKPFVIPTGDDSEGLICQALISGNVEAAVEFCMDAGRTADALVIASIGGGDLLQKVQLRHLANSSGAIGRLASALVLGDWVGFAEGTATSAWKAALSAALTSSSPDQLYAVCESIGAKLEKESDPNLQREAVICYLCSASVEPIVSLWLQQLGGLKADPSKLTHTVEMVLIARLAAIQRGRPVQTCGKLSNLLTSYAMKLASQGYLDGALNCLSGLQDQDLTYRLQCALGYAQPYSTRQNVQPRRGSAVPPQQNQWSSANRTRTPSYNSHSQPQDQWSGANSQPSPYSTGLEKPQLPPMAQPFNPQPPPVVPLQPPPMQPVQPTPMQQPPRPSSASSHGGLVGRNKYIRDPSVQSGTPSYGLNPLDSQPGYGNRNMMQPPNSGFGSSQQSFNSPPQSQFSQQQGVFSPQPYNPQINSSVPPLVPNVLQPTPATSNYPGAHSVGNAQGQFNQPADMGAEALQSNPQQSAPGWNDPPVFSANKQKEMSAEHAGTRQWRQMIMHSRAHHNVDDEAKQDFSAPAPITHPLFGVAPEQPAVPVMPNIPQQQYPPDNNAMSNNYMHNYSAAPPAMPPASYQSQMHPVSAVEAVPSPPPAVPPPPVQKGPIPEQHIHMQTVFDALRAQCSQAVHTAQYKRKLEDVQKKLEILYDLLRENKLSENALNTLHCVVQMVQVGDYANSLNTLTAIASGPDFAVVASFLPGLKVLIQIASNDQIHLR